MRQYPIYPMKGHAAQNYLSSLGCSVSAEQLTIPDHFLVTHNGGITYAVMRQGETVFCMQYYASGSLQGHWRVVVPVSYRITFVELAQSYNISRKMVGGIVCSFLVASQLWLCTPVQHSVAVAALKRFSDHTGHPYDLENVRVTLADS